MNSDAAALSLLQRCRLHLGRLGGWHRCSVFMLNLITLRQVLLSSGGAAPFERVLSEAWCVVVLLLAVASIVSPIVCKTNAYKILGESFRMSVQEAFKNGLQRVLRGHGRLQAAWLLTLVRHADIILDEGSFPSNLTLSTTLLTTRDDTIDPVAGAGFGGSKGKLQGVDFPGCPYWKASGHE